jgi:hypothetical protein
MWFLSIKVGILNNQFWGINIWTEQKKRFNTCHNRFSPINMSFSQSTLYTLYTNQIEVWQIRLTNPFYPECTTKLPWYFSTLSHRIIQDLDVKITRRGGFAGPWFWVMVILLTSTLLCCCCRCWWLWNDPKMSLSYSLYMCHLYANAYIYIEIHGCRFDLDIRSKFIGSPCQID